MTSRRSAEIISNFPTVPEPPLTPPPFYEAEVPGKGIGLIANRTIQRGETVIVELPTMLVQAVTHYGMNPAPRDILYNRALARLPEQKQGLFMGQMGKDVYDKMETNCFQVFIDRGNKHDMIGGNHLGCYPRASRFNHDCRPK